MPRGIPDDSPVVLWVFVAIFVAGVLMVIGGMFYAGLEVVSAQFISTWGFLQSIWYWLPYAIVGTLITILLVLDFVFFDIFWAGCLLIIVPLVLAVVGFVAICLIGLTSVIMNGWS